MCKVLIDYIKSNGLDKLSEEFGISVKRHEEYSNLVLLKYNQITSPASHPIVKECRGTILDTDNDFVPVCYPYRRFANYGETWADDIDFSKARIYEKVDGSLCQLFYYDDRWHIATSGSPSASGEVNGFGFSFKELFWKTWKELDYTLPDDEKCNYFFELVTPFNKVVVQHEKSNIILHGARRLSDFQELNPVVEAYINGWECVKIFKFADKESVLKSLEGMDGSKQEGFIACESGPIFKRVKIKCEDYLRKHRMVSSMSIRNMLDAIRTNEVDEVLVYCPQFKDMCYDLKTKYEHLVGKIEGVYSIISDIDDKKQFASYATKYNFSGILFGLKNGKIKSIKEGLASMQIKSLEDWLGVRGESDE